MTSVDHDLVNRPCAWAPDPRARATGAFRTLSRSCGNLPSSIRIARGGRHNGEASRRENGGRDAWKGDGDGPGGERPPSRCLHDSTGWPERDGVAGDG